MPIQTALDSISQNQGSPFGFKNRIINGGMVIDQRNNGSSVTPTGELYTLDRWYFAITQSSKLTSQQNAGSVTPPPGFTNYLGVTSSSSYSVLSADLFALKHSIEGFNTADLDFGKTTAKTVTMSFWVRSSLTGTFGCSLVNNAFNRSYVTTYTINSSNTWEYKTITIPGDQTGTWVGATNGIGLRLYFNLGASTTYSGGTTNTWNSGGYAGPSGTVSVVGTNAATWYITGVQLEVGSQASSFDYRPYGTELALCMRYYQDFRFVYGSSFGAPIMNSITSNADRIPIQPGFVPMRTTPSITAYSTGGTSGLLTEFSSGTNRTVSSISQNAVVGGSGYYQLSASATNGVYTSATYSAEL